MCDIFVTPLWAKGAAGVPPPTALPKPAIPLTPKLRPVQTRTGLRHHPGKMMTNNSCAPEDAGRHRQDDLDVPKTARTNAATAPQAGPPKQSERLTPEEIQARLVAAQSPRASVHNLVTGDEHQPLFQPPGMPVQANTVEDTRTSTTAMVTDNRDSGAVDMAVWSIRNNGGDVTPEERRAALEAIQSVGNRRDVAKVKATVIDLIVALDYMGYESDRGLLTCGVAFARFCIHQTIDGKFDPARDLNEFMFRDFLVHEKADVTVGTRGTYLSQLRRLRGIQPFKAKVVRQQAQPPYPVKVARRIWHMAWTIDDPVMVEMRTLLALTLGAGCRSEEIHEMRADQVFRTTQRTVVTASRNHFIRDVPVYGDYANWLGRRAKELDADQYLFRPGYKQRRNATSNLVTQATKRSDVFEGFRANRARHTWLCQYLVAGVPLNALSVAADVGKDSNLLADMLPFLPNLRPIDVLRAFDAAYKADQAAQSGQSGKQAS